MLDSRQIWITLLPGSDIHGIPESVTRAIDLSLLILVIISLDFFASLNLWQLINGVDISYLENNFFVCLVSSAKTKSTDLSV